MNSSDFAGDIEFGGEAPKIINMVVNNLDYDFASVVNNTAFIKNSEINFTANGRIKSPMPFAIPVQKFAQTAFSRFHISLTGDADLINVKSLRAENESASISAHGVIANGIAKGLDWVVFDARENAAIRCEMFGTVNDWSCSQWDYKDANFSATGKSTINGDTFILIMESDNLVLEGFTKQVPLLKSLFGKQNGNITATLGSGTRAALSVRGKDVEFSYSGHPNTNLASVPGANEFIKLLPERMQKSSGTMHNAEIKNGKLLSFSFEHFGKNHAWAISMDDPYNFRIYADARYLISAFYPSVDAKFLHPELDVLVTGNFKSKYITDLKINVGDNWIFGKFDGKKFDLGANMLDLDSLINPEFINNYESMKFVTAEPLTVPFALNLDLTLSADQIKFMDEVYDNFNYSLKPDNQKMSITDAAKGSILLTIDKKLSRYNIAVASNKFEILGLVLPRAAALNVADTMLTGRAELSTYGITANDFWVHMSGDLDLTFDGGILVGFDIDNFYAGSNSITKMNAEYAISDALSGGLSQLKSLQIAGHYEDGEFKTTSPLKASLRHSEIMGHIQTIRGRISANLNVLLRATSPEPRPISLLMNPNGEREFSLSEIMQTFDPDFMREFVKIHNRF
ncbi:MAG: hypothetical protein FWG18_02465 [Alphaproteobacteria bacterium]|nr:hypothetical protein [Alphaproteobacteria bacterium]